MCAKLPRATAALLLDPPPSTAWVEYEHLRAIAVTITDLYGGEYWSQVAYESTRDSMLPLIRSMVEGVLRLFGGSPHALLSRLPGSTSLTTRGFRVAYERLGDASASVTISYPAHDDVPDPMVLASGRSMLEMSCELCGCTAKWDPPVRVPSPSGSSFRFHVRWSVDAHASANR